MNSYKVLIAIAALMVSNCSAHYKENGFQPARPVMVPNLSGNVDFQSAPSRPMTFSAPARPPAPIRRGQVDYHKPAAVVYNKGRPNVVSYTATQQAPVSYIPFSAPVAQQAPNPCRHHSPSVGNYVGPVAPPAPIRVPRPAHLASPTLAGSY